MFKTVTVVKSTVTTDHKAIFTCADDHLDGFVNDLKIKSKINFRKCTPALNATFLASMKTVDYDSFFMTDLDNDGFSFQQLFDSFYEKLNNLLDKYYPVKVITISNKDPPYMTPQIKEMLRHHHHHHPRFTSVFPCSHGLDVSPISSLLSMEF